MGTTIYPTVPVAQPEAEPWPIDEHTIRVDEMFARQLDSEFAGHVRGLLHDPETGVSVQRGEAALEAIAGAMPALGELKERTLAQAIGPRHGAGGGDSLPAGPHGCGDRGGDCRQGDRRHDQPARRERHVRRQRDGAAAR